jgi:alpha-1,2-mannosyltransferase
MRSFTLPSMTCVERRNAIVATVILAAASAVILTIALGAGVMKDLEVYLAAGRRFGDGASLYGEHFGASLPTPLPYTYPPMWAAAMALVAWLPWSWVDVAWTLIDLALLGWVVRISYARLLERLGDRRWIAWAALVAVCGLTAPILSVFDLGQIGIVLMALVLADALPRHTRLPRGVLVGVATAIKLLPGVFVLYWAVTTRWRAVLVSTVTAAALWGVAAVLRPGTSSTYWFQVVSHPERAGDTADVFNQSLNGMLQRVGLNAQAMWAVAAMIVMVVGLWRAREAHLAGNELAAISLVALAGVLASPISWVHHAVWIVPVTGVLLGDGRDRRRRVAWAATVVVFVADVPLWGRAGLPLDGFRVLVENAFVLAMLALLVFLPIDRAPAPIVLPDLEAAEAAGVHVHA